MKEYIITGAGSGMGRASAIALGEDSESRLLLIGRNAAALEATKSMLPHPHLASIAALDVRNAYEMRQALQAFAPTNLKGVFANAGVGGENHYGAADRWEEIISINLTGTYITIQEALPYLRSAQDVFKHILITSSCLARFGVPRYTAYCTAKTGLLGLTRSLAVELASEQILVNALCPGWVETEMARAGIQKLADVDGVSYQESFDRQMSYVPTGRIGQPEEIAAMVKFLFSDAQVSMTGQGIDINNGSYMQ